MTTENLIECACCRGFAPESTCVHDDDLRGAVCDDCRKLLRGSVAWLALRQVNVPEEGILPVNIRGCFHGLEAGDNQRVSAP